MSIYIKDIDEFDAVFDKAVVDLKPYIMGLQSKNDRRRCALWIKKLCEPTGPGLNGRKLRNQHARILLSTLKSGGKLSRPYTDRPNDGPLPSVDPAYASWLDGTGDPPSNRGDAPDWVDTELAQSAPVKPGELNRSNSLYGSRDRAFDESPAYRRPAPTSSPALPYCETDRPMFSSSTGLLQLPGGTSSDSALPVDQASAQLFRTRLHQIHLQMERKHDTDLQTILNRKNLEMDKTIESYKKKVTELESVIQSMEEKTRTLVMETNQHRESGERQLHQWKLISEQSLNSLKQDYDKQIANLQQDHDQESVELQRQRHKELQELMEETNQRVRKMEAEYGAQQSTSAQIITQLEDKFHLGERELHDLKDECTNISRIKTDLERKLSVISADFESMQLKYFTLEREHDDVIGQHEMVMKKLRSKTESTVEFLKEEHESALARSGDKCQEFQEQLNILKHQLSDAELSRQRQLRDLESRCQSEKLHSDQIYEKKIHTMNKDFEGEKSTLSRRADKLNASLLDAEKLIQDQTENLKASKEAMNVRHQEEIKKLQNKYERKLANFNLEAEKLKSDLVIAAKSNEKIKKNFERRIAELVQSSEIKAHESKMKHEQHKLNMSNNFHVEKEQLLREKEVAVADVKFSLEEDFKIDLTKIQMKVTKYQQISQELDGQVAKLTDDVIRSDMLRKQQLVELGTLREDERRRSQRNNDASLAKLRSEMDQEKLLMQKKHSQLLVDAMAKADDRLKALESSCLLRIGKASEVAHSEEMLKGRVKSLQRQLQDEKMDYESDKNTLALEYSKRMRQMVPQKVKTELESTILSLKNQVNLLHQRASLLQTQIDGADASRLVTDVSHS